MSRSKTESSAMDVAWRLIRLAANERPDEPMYLSNLQLQKLLFYVQEWTLAEWDRPMFSDRVEAWPQGPVVRAVWKRFTECGSKPITEDPESDSLTDHEIEMVREVWDHYKAYSSIAIADLTHNEPAFIRAREGLGPKDSSHREIRREWMKSDATARMQEADRWLEKNREKLLKRSFTIR